MFEPITAFIFAFGGAISYVATAVFFAYVGFENTNACVLLYSVFWIVTIPVHCAVFLRRYLKRSS